MSDHRRRKLILSAPGLLIAPAMANARPMDAALHSAPPYSIALRNLHTGERFKWYFGESAVIEKATHTRFNRFLRDHYSGDATTMDPNLIDHLITLQHEFQIQHSEFEVISGYRSPKTNAMLRARGRRVAKYSMHMSGQAIDVRLSGVKLKNLRDAARSLKVGGVGYYPRSKFLHFDTGRVRFW